MGREVLLVAEMIEAAEQAQLLVTGIDLTALEGDRRRFERLVD